MAFNLSHFGIRQEDLPSRWKADRFDTIANFNPDQLGNNFPHSTIEYLDISNVSAGSFDRPTQLAIAEAPSRAKRLVKPQDTILSTVRPGNRAYVFLQNIPDNLVVSTGFAVIRAKPKEADPRFVYYISTCNPIIDYLASIADEKTAYPSVNPTDIAECVIPIPPLHEQRAIANILGTLDDKIELNRKMNETLEAMARALFKSWFVDFDPVRAKMEGRWKRGQSLPGLSADLYDLFPSRFVDSELGEIPKGWDVRTVGDQFNITMGQSPPGETYNNNGEGSPFYQGRTDFGFRFPTRRIYCSAPTRYAKTGDTLISVRAPVGDINMAAEECAIGRGVAAARHKTGSRSYTFQFMKTLNVYFSQFEAEGSVFGSIGKIDFNKLPCIVPPQKIVGRYEQVIFPADSQIENSELESGTLKTLRDTLLPKLISGELKLRNRKNPTRNEPITIPGKVGE